MGELALATPTGCNYYESGSMTQVNVELDWWGTDMSLSTEFEYTTIPSIKEPYSTGQSRGVDEDYIAKLLFVEMDGGHTNRMEAIDLFGKGIVEMYEDLIEQQLMEGTL